MGNAKCWDCQYCDKESALVGGKWKLTRTGYCLAEFSAANGKDSFYEKVYVNTIQKKCNLYEPIKK